MQLPYDEEILLVSGTPPIRANKLRYFKDSNFTERVLKAPSTSGARKRRRSPDWEGGPDAWTLEDGLGNADGPEPKRAQEPELGRDLDAPQKEPEPDPDIADDDPADPLGDDHLDAVRKSKGFDRDDDDFLPDF